LLPEVVLFILL